MSAMSVYTLIIGVIFWYIDLTKVILYKLVIYIVIVFY